jgi:carbon-monoxide dehydrogenase large subunit
MLDQTDRPTDGPSGDLTAGTTRYAGARIARVEDPRLLTGHGTYVDDVTRPGMLHACFVRSPYARARIVGIDTSAALELDGVHAVFTAADLNPGVHEAWFALAGKDVPDSPRPPLADTEVRFVGDLVALVVADDRYIAEDAADLVDVEYDALIAVVDYTTADTNAELVFEGWADTRANPAGRPPAYPSGGVRYLPPSDRRTGSDDSGRDAAPSNRWYRGRRGALSANDRS